MREFIRSEPPAILITIDQTTKKPLWQAIGDAYTQNRIINPVYRFQWRSVQGKSINQHLLPDLAELTDGHCSYCDMFPLKEKERSIDHFLPKSNPAYYYTVCQWENLYLSCVNCQGFKREQHDPALLRPDDIMYSFQQYFVYSYITHEIEVSPRATPYQQQQAATTLRIFGLNDTGHLTARRQALERYANATNPDTADYNYRFMLL